MIYKTEEERFGYQSYRWNAFMKYSDENFRLTVAFARQGNFIRISQLTNTGWNVIADEWCIDVKAIKDLNPYNGSEEWQTYTRCLIEKAMLKFIDDVFDDGTTATYDYDAIKTHMEEISSLPVPNSKPEKKVVSVKTYDGHQHGMSDAEIENSYF